jgi:hypothetical protein
MTPEQAAKDRYPPDLRGGVLASKNNLLQAERRLAFLAGVEYGKEWISVETPPELTEPLMGYNDDNEREVIIENYQATVLGYNPEIGTFKARYVKRGWAEISSVSVNSTITPTHWMTLPTPPKI